MDEQIGAFGKVHQRRKRRCVAREDDMAVTRSEGQGEGIDKRRMDIAHRGDGQPVLAVERHLFNGVDADKPGQFGAPFIRLPQVYIGFHRCQERVPVILEPGRAPDRQRRLQSGCPGGVDQRAEFQIMVRMEMRDDDGFQLAQIDVLVDQPPRYAKSAIDDDLLTVQADKR